MRIILSILSAGFVLFLGAPETTADIPLHSGVIRTDTQPGMATARAPRTAFAGRELQLIQYDGPIRPEWRDQLEQDGYRVISYVPENAYLVYGDASASGKMTARRPARKHIHWHGRLLAADKIHPNTKTSVPGKRDPRSPEGSTGLYSIQLVSDPDANAATLAFVNAVKSGPLRRQDRVLEYLNLIVPLAAGDVEALAALPDVVSIRAWREPVKFGERQAQILAGQISGNLPSGPGYLAWLGTMGFTQSQFDASGFIVNVSDSGIDIGTTNVGHFGLMRLGNTGSNSRVAYNRLEGTANAGSTLAGCDGHGNINAHIIAGYNSLSGTNQTDSSGFRFGLGLCPFVKVGSSVIFDPTTYTNPDFEDLMSRAYSNGARISSESWGADTAGDYDADAQAFDALVRDAQPAGSAVSVTGNQQMVIVTAAGNAGPGLQTVGSPATAKNVLTIGASENVQSLATTNRGNNAPGSDGCSFTDADADNLNDMTDFSSRGPCLDGRRKPEVSAPGTHVSGGVPQRATRPDPFGIGDDVNCFDAEGVCALTGSGTQGSPNNFFPLGQQFFTVSSGTSHSTPAASGIAALLRQRFINLGLTPPSPALTKALMVASTRHLTGTYANDTLWSNIQGMGLPDMSRMFDNTPNLTRDQVAADKFTASGQSRSFMATVASNSLPIRIVLAYTDAPGNTIGNAYNNNLDLRVSLGGKTYLGNVFSGAASVPGGSADARNNLESVFLPAGISGNLLVEVLASNINSDGVPNETPALDQDFALYVYNAVPATNALLVSTGYGIQTESCGLGNGAVDPGETVTLGISLRNGGNSGATNVVGTLLPATDLTNIGPAQVFGALPAGGSAVTQFFSFTVFGVCGGTVTARIQVQDGAADRGIVEVPVALGSNVLTTTIRTNTTLIQIPQVSGLVTGKLASPYPSSIAISNLQGRVSGVELTLKGFSHTYPDDIDILLVSPSNTSVLLLSAAGGIFPVVGANITFSDNGSTPVPDDGPIVSGTFRPGNYDVGQVFSNPAPPLGYAANLAEFNNMNPNGTWSLYIMDVFSGDSGAITSGWELALTTAQETCCESNNPPILETMPDRAGEENSFMSFSATAQDLADNDPITLSASNLPSWASFTTVTSNGYVTGFFTGTPDQTGIWTVLFYAVDKDGSDSQLVQISAGPEQACGLIISEYVEGSGNNRAIELHNGGTGVVDLTAGEYLLEFYFDGSSGAGTSLGLGGTLNPGESFTVGHSSAAIPLLIMLDATAGGTWFDGNDTIVLRSGGPGGSIVDSIGQLGFNPGAEWGTGVVSTLDNTLIRKPVSTRGDTNPWNTFVPQAEWNGLGGDDFGNLQNHLVYCDDDGLPPAWEVSNGLNPQDDTGNNGADGDPDGDGFRNIEEYIADTHPTNGLSLLQMAFFNAPTNPTLGWISSTARMYHLQWQTVITSPTPWSNLITDLPGNGSTQTVSDGQWSSSRVYRINVELP